MYVLTEVFGFNTQSEWKTTGVKKSQQNRVPANA